MKKYNLESHGKLILSIEKINIKEILKIISDKIGTFDAFSLKFPVFFEGISVVKEICNFLSKYNSQKPIILDLKLSETDQEIIKTILQQIEATCVKVLTVWGVLDESTLSYYVQQARKIDIFAVLEIEGMNIGYKELLLNALKAKRCGCKGIILSIRTVDKIPDIRDKIGKDVLILVALESSEQGKGIKIGADFEIISNVKD